MSKSTNKSSASSPTSKSKGGGFLARKTTLTRSSSKDIPAIDIPSSTMASENATTRPAMVKSPLTALLSRNQAPNPNLTLVTVTVLGSPGPLRFLIDKNGKVSKVLECALKNYAREGRLPALNHDCVEIYCNNGDFRALNACECVNDLGTRSFLLYRKKPEEVYDSSRGPAAAAAAHAANSSSGPFKHWWNLMSSIACSH